MKYKNKLRNSQQSNQFYCKTIKGPLIPQGSQYTDLY